MSVASGYVRTSLKNLVLKNEFVLKMIMYKMKAVDVGKREMHLKLFAIMRFRVRVYVRRLVCRFRVQARAQF